jgi:sugar/nucleoside kinase (ribokinase family)
MVACARLDCRSRYVGLTGDDDAGALVRSTLGGEGVDISAVQRVEAPNRFAFILVDHAGHRTVIWHRDPQLETLADRLEPAVPASGRVVLLDASDCRASLAAARAAKAAGVPVVLDVDAYTPDVDPLLRTVDVIIASLSFFSGFGGRDDPGAALARLEADVRPAVGVVTLGAEGSLARVNGSEIRTPAFDVPVVDSTGAGDAFRGGFVASWIRFGGDAGVEQLLGYASAVAGLNCGALGAQSGLPRWPAVDLLFTQQARVRSK